MFMIQHRPFETKNRHASCQLPYVSFPSGDGGFSVLARATCGSKTTSRAARRDRVPRHGARLAVPLFICRPARQGEARANGGTQWHAGKGAGKTAMTPLLAAHPHAPRCCWPGVLDRAEFVGGRDRGGGITINDYRAVLCIYHSSYIAPGGRVSLVGSLNGGIGREGRVASAL